MEVTELANSVASAVLGAKIESEGGKDLVFSTEDNAPYSGLGFYINKMVKGVKSYHGIYYPKAKAAMQGTEYATKGGRRAEFHSGRTGEREVEGGV